MFFCVPGGPQQIDLESALFLPQGCKVNTSVLQVELCVCARARVCVCVCVSAHSVAQCCPTLCNPMDCSLSGSSVHEILQSRILEWVALS